MPHPPPDALWVRVYYEDTDFSGRVYHASYLRFLERGRTEWLRRRGFAHRDLAQSSGVAFAVRSLQIDYLAPAMMDDLLTVETSVAAARGASITFRQRILRGDKELVTATVLAAAIRGDRPARIPADLRRLLQPPVLTRRAALLGRSEAARRDGSGASAAGFRSIRGPADRSRRISRFRASARARVRASPFSWIGSDPEMGITARARDCPGR